MIQHNSTLLLWKGVALYKGVIEDNHPHKHHAAHICIGIDGKLELFLQNEWHKTRVAFIPANTCHQLKNNDTHLAIILLDGSSAFGRAIANTGILLSDKALSLPKPFPNTIAGAQTFLDDLFIEMGIDHPSSPHISKRDQRIIASTLYIEQNLDRPITASEVAKHVGLSQSRFVHLFTLHTGLPMRRYILWRRIILTIDAIKAGQDLTSAAHFAGFADSAHFSRTFRQTFGMSPSNIFKNSQNVQVIT